MNKVEEHNYVIFGNNFEAVSCKSKPFNGSDNNFRINYIMKD